MLPLIDISSEICLFLQPLTNQKSIVCRPLISAKDNPGGCLKSKPAGWKQRIESGHFSTHDKSLVILLRVPQYRFIILCANRNPMLDIYHVNIINTFRFSTLRHPHPLTTRRILHNLVRVSKLVTATRTQVLFYNLTNCYYTISAIHFSHSSGFALILFRHLRTLF